MSFSVNPGTFQSMQIETAKEKHFFLSQLSTLLTQITTQITSLQNPNTLAGLLNGSGSLKYNALNTSASALGAVSTNQSVNCNSAAIVVVSLQLTASVTLTLNNLGISVPVTVIVASTGAFTFKMAATLPGGTAYAIIGMANSNAQTNLITTGIVFGGVGFRALVGNTSTPSTLQMAFS